MRPVLVLAVAAALFSTSVCATDAGIPIEIKALAPEPASATYHLQVSGDIDGDGTSDERILSIQCDGTRLREATLRHNPESPRDAASGMASGKRASGGGGAGGVADGSTNQWPRLTPQADAELPRLRISSVARTSQAGRSTVVLSQPAIVCPALQQAATGVINTSRSNVKN